MGCRTGRSAQYLGLASVLISISMKVLHFFVGSFRVGSFGAWGGVGGRRALPRCQLHCCIVFGETRRFSGLGSVDGRDIARAREDFCRSLVDVPIKMIALHLDFLKKAWISRFQFDPVHLGPPMSPALTDRPIGPRIGKNLPKSDSVRWIARAGSVRHAQFRIFTL